MAIIKSFKAVRPQAALASKVATLPYDVMNTREAKAMADGNPYSFLQVSRAEIDFAEGFDEHSPIVYDKAAVNFRKLINDGVLIQDATPCLYIYAQTMNGRRQYGLVACSSVADYFNDLIKKHEYTRPEKELDRINHMKALQAHVGPIFLTYPHHQTVDEIIKNIVTSTSPVYDFTTEDAIQHTVWLIDNAKDIEQLESIFKNEIPFTYIADGHHRTASAAKVGKELASANSNNTGNEDYNFFLSVLFPDNQLSIMDYNRVVKDLNDYSTEQFIDKLAENFEVAATTIENAKPTVPHHLSMYLNKQWYSLIAKPSIIKTDPIGVLDISILSENVLGALLGIKDQRTDKRIDFVGGIRGLEGLQKRVDIGDMQIAFAIYPVSLQQLMDIADSGNVMPPKSTWFEPKLRDGLFSHLF